MLSHAILSGVGLSEPSFIVPPQPDRERRKRILAALGLTGGKGDSPHLPERPGGCFAQMGTVPFSGKRQPGSRVDEQTLVRFYDYLAARLELPFVAYYPSPSSPSAAEADSCEVIELLSPRKHICDEIDGLYCRTRRGKFLVNLPLVELTVLQPGTNLELLEDYEYWFWHWRD